MSFETEKIITLLNKFLDEHGDEYENDEEAIADFQMKYNLNTDIFSVPIHYGSSTNSQKVVTPHQLIRYNNF